MRTYLYIAAILSASVLVQCVLGFEFGNLIECQKELGLTNESFDLLDSKSKESTFKCLLACMLKKSNVLKKGKILIDKELDSTQKHVQNEDDDTLKEKMTECANKANEGKDDCEVAGILFECIAEQIGILPFKKKK